MSNLLDDYHNGNARRMWIKLWQSPQGRDLGRYLLLEKGKEDGNLKAMLNELLDIGAETAMDLYGSPEPVTMEVPRR
jgi:sulfur relay (sulfurtransferase) DsrC/TusE family protein